MLQEVLVAFKIISFFLIKMLSKRRCYLCFTDVETELRSSGLFFQGYSEHKWQLMGLNPTLYHLLPSYKKLIIRCRNLANYFSEPYHSNL